MSTCLCLCLHCAQCPHDNPALPRQNACYRDTGLDICPATDVSYGCGLALLCCIAQALLLTVHPHLQGARATSGSQSQERVSRENKALTDVGNGGAAGEPMGFLEEWHSAGPGVSGTGPTCGSGRYSTFYPPHPPPSWLGDGTGTCTVPGSRPASSHWPHLAGAHGI
jgi:hypothetical protein